MIPTTRNLLNRQSIQLYLCFLVVCLFPSSMTWAQSAQTSANNPAIADYFKHRNHHDALKQIQNSINRHIKESRDIVRLVEQGIDSTESSARTAVHAQIEGKLKELALLKQELKALRKTQPNYKTLFVSVEKRIHQLSKDLKKLKSAKNKKNKTQAIQSLKSDLDRYQQRKRPKTSLPPANWGAQPRQKTVPANTKPQNDSSAQNIHFAPNDGWALKVFHTVVDTVVPAAVAETYEQLSLDTGVSTC